ncbi:MAG: hypothetical protein ACR2PL_16045 [Dehalococcoidia bacterium]
MTEGGIQVSDEERIEVNGPEEVPDFASEDEEAEFWATRSFSDAYWARMAPVPESELPPIDRSRIPGVGIHE